MSMEERMKARANLYKALQDALPMDEKDGRIVEVCAAVEELIDTKIAEAFDHHAAAHQLGV